MLKHKYICPIFLLFGLCSSIWLGRTGDYRYLLLCCILALALTAWGAFDIRLGYFMPVYWRKKGALKGQIALTFDDGPTAYTAEILALLKQYGHTATFFCIGKQVEAYPEVARRIVREGHSLGNHTYRHPTNFGFLAETDLRAEMQAADKAIARVTGKKVCLFRPPFGVSNPIWLRH